MILNINKIIFIASVIIVMAFVLPRSSFAQILFKNPIHASTYIVSFFDNNDSIAGTQKYNCALGSSRNAHHGVDFHAVLDTPVYVTGAGRIVYLRNGCKDVSDINNLNDTRCGDGFGNHYRIDHEGDTSDQQGLTSIYAHMKSSSVNIPVGTPVACSQPLGLSASSGNSEAPHLHFETRKTGIYGTPIDPYAGSCSHTGLPNWTSLNNEVPTTTCDNHPLVPSNVTVTNPSTSSLQINFKDNALNETNILMERKIGASGTWSQIANFGALSGASSWYWTNGGLSSGTTYCFRLRAQNSYGYSDYLNESCGTTLISSSLPLAPSNVSVTNPTTNSLQVNFKDNATDETNILIERKIGISGSYISLGGFGALAGVSSWYWTNTGLSSKTTYCYRLKAVNAVGSSAYSNEACGTTL